MGKSTISMAIFNSYVSHYQRVMCEPGQMLITFRELQSNKIDINPGLTPSRCSMSIGRWMLPLPIANLHALIT